MHIRKGSLEIATGRGKRFILKPYDFFTAGFKTVPYNEVIAYEISEILGFHVVPPTKISATKVNIGGNEITMEGSLQDYILEALPLNKYVGQVNQEDITKMVVFDVLICNTDRTLDNVVVDLFQKPHAIDNGFSLCFHLPEEAEQRDFTFYKNPFDIQEPGLNIDPLIIGLVDIDYAMELVSTIQNQDFKLDLTINFGGNEEQRIKEILQTRIKYLPKLFHEQVAGGQHYEYVTPV